MLRILQKMKSHLLYRKDGVNISTPTLVSTIITILLMARLRGIDPYLQILRSKEQSKGRARERIPSLHNLSQKIPELHRLF